MNTKILSTLVIAASFYTNSAVHSECPSADKVMQALKGAADPITFDLPGYILLKGEIAFDAPDDLKLKGEPAGLRIDSWIDQQGKKHLLYYTKRSPGMGFLELCAYSSASEKKEEAVVIGKPRTEE